MGRVGAASARLAPPGEVEAPLAAWALGTMEATDGESNERAEVSAEQCLRGLPRERLSDLYQDGSVLLLRLAPIQGTAGSHAADAS